MVWKTFATFQACKNSQVKHLLPCYSKKCIFVMILCDAILESLPSKIKA